MANYGRDTGEDYSDVGDALKVGAWLLAGFAGMAVLKDAHTAVKTEKKISEKQNYQNKIAACDREINELRSEFLGSLLNSDRIEELEARRAELQEKYDSLCRK